MADAQTFLVVSSSIRTGFLCRLGRWTLAAAVCVSGCATYRQTDRDVTEAIEHWQRPVQVTRSSNRSPTTVPADEVTLANESGALPPSSQPADPLPAYIEQALSRNPAIQVAVEEVQAKLVRIPQATALPDPVLRTIARPEPIQTAAGDVFFTLGVAQKFPWPGKLDRAGQAAAAEVRMAIENLNAVRVRIIADVERAYYRVYLADRSIELTAANRKLLGELEQVVASKYRVGQVQQEDLLRMQSELSSLFDEERRYVRTRESAAAALNALMDRSPATEIPLTEPLVMHGLTAETDRILALAERHNPELAALAYKADRDRERVNLADLGYWPDLEVGFEWNYLEGRDPWVPPASQRGNMPRPRVGKAQEGDDNWAILVQMNLPIWVDRIEAARREARHLLARTTQERRSAANMVAFRVFDAHTRMQSHRDTLDLLQLTLIPQARQTYNVSLTAYQAGRSDFLTVIDNWRRWLAFELMWHRELTELQSAFSELQREVGVQLVVEKMADHNH